MTERAQHARRVEIRQEKGLLLDSSDPLARILDLAEDAVLSTNEEQQIVLFNQGAERIFGYTAQEVYGRALDMLLPERFVQIHRQHIMNFAESPISARRMGERREIFGRRKDGTEFPAEASISKVEVDGRWLFTVILRDITERKLTEEKIRSSLREKEILLKEIHHRVKNNLQVVSSLMGLQARAAPDEQTRKIFQESQNRIQSMALLHERLYQSKNLSDIDCAEYVRQLAAFLFRAYGVSSNRVRLSIDVDAIQMNMDEAVPVGLILNELLSNCLKHAFPEGREGEIVVALQEGPERKTRMLVRDNGVGLKDEVNLWATKTLGWRLIRTLADQLKASVAVRTENGTEIELIFDTHAQG